MTQLFMTFFIIILMLNIFGVSNVIDVLNTYYYIKIFGWISCSSIIIYHIVNIFLLHKFYSGNINISPVLPNFILNWLNEIKDLASKKETYKFFKDSSYIQILIYLLIILFISII
jgi:hypothetical protein